MRTNFKASLKEFAVLLLASLILALAVSYKNPSKLYWTSLSFFIIIGINILAKKLIGYNLETKVETKFWSWYQYGFRKDEHFKAPLPMAWLPLVVSLLTKGSVWWLPILEFDVAPKTERVSRRHGLYRFTEVTEWHMGIIALSGVIANVIVAILGYILGFEFFSKLGIYYAIWSLVPLSSLDGSKILFSSKGIWITSAIIAAIFFGWTLVI